jgi:hypothetical protein
MITATKKPYDGTCGVLEHAGELTLYEEYI